MMAKTCKDYGFVLNFSNFSLVASYSLVQFICQQSLPPNIQNPETMVLLGIFTYLELGTIPWVSSENSYNSYRISTHVKTGERNQDQAQTLVVYVVSCHPPSSQEFTGPESPSHHFFLLLLWGYHPHAAEDHPETEQTLLYCSPEDRTR